MEFCGVFERGGGFVVLLGTNARYRVTPAYRRTLVANIDLRGNAGRRRRQDQSQERARTERVYLYIRR